MGRGPFLRTLLALGIKHAFNFTDIDARLRMPFNLY